LTLAFERRRATLDFSGAGRHRLQTRRFSNRKTKSARSAKAKSTGLLFAGISRNHLFLEGNLDAALQHWNLLDKPRLRSVAYPPPLKLRESLRDRAVAFNAPQVLTVDALLTTQARLDNLGIFSSRRDGTLPGGLRKLRRNVALGGERKRLGRLQSRRCRFAFERLALLYDLSGVLHAPYTGPGSRPLSAAEQAYLAQYQRWRDDDRGYGAIQSTRPQTLSYGLNDSPARPGCLGAGEMARLGPTPAGDIDATFSRDFLLTVVTLYWATQTIASSIRDYVDNRRLADELSLADVVTVPTAVAVFHQFIDDGTPPREWAERLYNIRRWTPMPQWRPLPSRQRYPACSAATSQPSSTTSQSAR